MVDAPEPADGLVALDARPTYGRLGGCILVLTPVRPGRTSCGSASSSSRSSEHSGLSL